MPLEGLKQRADDTAFLRRPNFSLFHSDPKVNIYKEFKALDLAADNVNTRDNWKGALLRVGVFPEKSKQVQEEEAEDDLNQGNNPILKRQVETIRNLVQSYMKIVTKTQLDLVPKITMHLLIDDVSRFHLYLLAGFNSLVFMQSLSLALKVHWVPVVKGENLPLLRTPVKKYLKSDLLPILYALDANRLMEESPEEKRRKQDLVTMYNTMKEALNIIADVTTHTITTPVPPPITDDWREPEGEGNGSSQRSATGPSRPSVGPGRGSPSTSGNFPAPQPRVAPPIPQTSRPLNAGPPPPLVPASPTAFYRGSK
ncbi:unnamed protein product [Hymenolepis diminuta]|uniref:dynamin GTPase n=1 Tax=Hymenolepis diminuta TaxID=6216 RepID=A0A3P6ZL20_HYMDI|nr:unnamed protein product [Hymenolepis diminuta]